MCLKKGSDTLGIQFQSRNEEPCGSPEVKGEKLHRKYILLELLFHCRVDAKQKDHYETMHRFKLFPEDSKLSCNNIL